MACRVATRGTGVVFLMCFHLVLALYGSGYRKIRPRMCWNAAGQRGTCMFNYECRRSDGRPLGTCMDGFLVGSCCGHDENSNFVQPNAAAFTEPPRTSNFTVGASSSSASSSTASESFGVSAQLHLITTSTPLPVQISLSVANRPAAITTTLVTLKPTNKPTLRPTPRPAASSRTSTVPPKTPSIAPVTTSNKVTFPPLSVGEPIVTSSLIVPQSTRNKPSTTTTKATTTRRPTTTTRKTTKRPSTTVKPQILATSSPVIHPAKDCGIPRLSPQTRIVGGTSASFGAWPWQASVRRTAFYGFASTHRCGGAIVSEKWIATAGHCVDDLLLSQIRVRVGEYDFSSVNEPYPYIERNVRRKVVHPKYNFYTYDNDLALVLLEQPLDMSLPHLAPLCLPPSTTDLLVGRNATVTGWGRLSDGGVLPTVLQEVTVPIVSNSKCNQMFETAGRPEIIPEIMMCAGYETGGKDSCQGDSGGPLQVRDADGHWFLAGIISWGIGCGDPNLPGVCTRISKFKDWIQQNIS